MLTKERGGGRENRKEETEWLIALAGYRYKCASYQEMVEQLSATWRREKRESETRSDVSDLGHLCYLNTYTLWTMDPWRGSPTKLLWPSHWYSKSTDWRAWVSGHYTVLKVYRSEESESVGNRVEQPDSQSGLGQNGHDWYMEWTNEYDGLIMTAYPDPGSVLMRTDRLSSSGPLWKNWWDCVPTPIIEIENACCTHCYYFLSVCISMPSDSRSVTQHIDLAQSQLWNMMVKNYHPRAN